MVTKKDVEDHIAHYASEYYDPVKANAYYMENRDLKGRQPASKEQNQAVSYANKEIGVQRKAESTKTSEDQKARMDALRTNGLATKERITAKLEAAIAKIEADLAKVKYNKIPENATPKLRAFLNRQNQIISAGAKKKASSATSAVKKAAAEEKKKVGAELKSAVSTARESYKAAKEQLTNKYDSASKTEEANIRSAIK